MSVQGTLKWYSAEKGYGFISRGNGEKDVFLHARHLGSIPPVDLKEGLKLSFDIEEGPKGQKATNVSRVD